MYQKPFESFYPIDYMKLLKTCRVLLILSSSAILLLQDSGCAKEYSYEGGDSLGYHPILDSFPSGGPPGEFPNCAFCHPTDQTTLGSWNFIAGNSYLCGTTTNSGFMGGYTRTQFTFFGPSACSVDTGIVVSAELPVALDRDRHNIVTNLTAFYYYDHKSPYDIFDSYIERAAFTVTVQSYTYSTGVTIGSFYGTVFKANGDTAYVASGRYKVLVKM